MHRFKDRREQFTEILQQTEERFGRGSSDDWRNRDFEDLSFEINLSAKILISSATLKRMFGKVKTAHEYFPQESTINALKIYSDYTEPVQSIPQSTNKKQFIYYGIAIAAVILSAYFLFLNSSDDYKGPLELELIKVEGLGPATAFFKYSIPETKDSLFLNFGDETDRYTLNDKNETYSHFYAFPGLFNAYILDEKKNVLSDTVKVFVPTDGWRAHAHYFEKELKERYYPVPIESNSHNSIFHASKHQLANLGLDSTEIVVVRLDNFNKTVFSGDQFIYKSRFKNSSFWPAVRCFSVYFTIQGSMGEIRFKVVGDGCSHYSEYIIGEKKGKGTTQDLKNLVVDINKWNEIKIENKNKHVRVSLDDAIIFEDAYKKSVGNIIGTSIMFHGSGWVDFVHLQTVEGKPIIENNF